MDRGRKCTALNWTVRKLVADWLGSDEGEREESERFSLRKEILATPLSGTNTDSRQFSTMRETRKQAKGCLPSWWLLRESGALCVWVCVWKISCSLAGGKIIFPHYNFFSVHSLSNKRLFPFHYQCTLYSYLPCKKSFFYGSGVKANRRARRWKVIARNLMAGMLAFIWRNPCRLIYVRSHKHHRSTSIAVHQNPFQGLSDIGKKKFL